MEEEKIGLAKIASEMIFYDNDCFISIMIVNNKIKSEKRNKRTTERIKEDTLVFATQKNIARIPKLLIITF